MLTADYPNVTVVLRTPFGCEFALHEANLAKGFAPHWVISNASHPLDNVMN